MQIGDRSALEAILQDDEAGPMEISFSLLQEITDKFSEDNKIGEGGFGVVYKGRVVGDRFVAVKKLLPWATIDEKKFQSEVGNLAAVKHRNIVRLIGYCAHTHHQYVKHEREMIYAEVRERLLCLDFMPNGSLRSYRKDMDEPHNKFAWHVCYEIINGICQGLHHLHEKNITHLDLRPDNILLDKDMVPKITDFGLSRLLGEGKSRTRTQNLAGAWGYMAPEYFSSGVISLKADIYSLGAIIRTMVAGHGTERPIENVAESWWRMMPRGHTSREALYEQVKTCIGLSKDCMEVERARRPNIVDIKRRLDHSIASGVNTEVEASIMLSSRQLNIAWSDHSQYWRWRSFQESRFGECAELDNVHFLSISGEIQFKDLSPNTGYTVYLVYRLGSGSSGFHAGQESSIKLLRSDRTITTSRASTVSLDPEERGISEEATYPNNARGDGWMEVKLAEFHPNDMRQDEKSVIVDIREVEDYKKAGLIVEGMEFRPNIS